MTVDTNTPPDSLELPISRLSTDCREEAGVPVREGMRENVRAEHRKVSVGVEPVTSLLGGGGEKKSLHCFAPKGGKVIEIPVTLQSLSGG